MPTTINGIGTHYYGKKNKQARTGVCQACGGVGRLESYDTRLWFVVFFIPLVPLGRKRIIDQCPACSRHFAAKRDQWEMVRQLNVSGAMERYRAQPSPEAALELHAQMLGFHLHDDAKTFREAVVEEYPGSAVLCAGLASHLDQVGSSQEATPLFEKALALRPDLPEARVGVALRKTMNGELDEARALLAFLEEPGAGQLYSLGPLEGLAQAYQRVGRHAEVIAICKHLVAEFPRVGQIHGFRKFVSASEKAAGGDESILPKRSFSLAGLLNPKSETYAPWQRWAAFGAVVLLLAALGMAGVNEYKRRHRTVIVMNELGQPVEVSIDGGPPLAVSSRTQVELAEGRHQVTVRGSYSEQFDLDMRTGYFERWTKSPVWAINVGGAAPLALDTLYYAQNPRPSEREFFIGDQVVYYPHVDYVFEAPPPTIQIESRRAQVVKTHLSVIGEPAVGLFEYALADGDASAAFRFAEARLWRTPADAALLASYVQESQLQHRTDRARAFLERGLWRDPIVISWHRAYQELVEPGARDLLLARYDEALEKDPESAVLLYLRGRASLARAESLEFFRRACDADGSLAWPWLALAADAAARGDWRESRNGVDKALDRNLDDPTLERLRHVVRLAQGEFGPLEAEYRERVARASPYEGVAALMRLCEVLAVQRKSEEARAAYADWEARIPAAARSGDNLQALRQWLQFTLGELRALEEALATAPDRVQPDLRLHVLLALGRPADVVRDSELAKRLEEPSNALAASVAFACSGDEDEARIWRERACAGFDRKDADRQRAAALLRSPVPPTREQIDEIVLDVGYKALLLAALARQHPERGAELAAEAERLNVSRFPFYYLVKQAVAREP
jgi:tetratricopeptide (TPR) repeat protein